ncbi:hypothetical protein Tco_1455948 [Tanacetum coccineum]
MFNSDDENEFWNSQQDWNIVSWKLHGSSGVHTLVTETGLVIHMLVEKKYPLRKKVLVQMLKLKLESEEDSTMALELIRFIKKLLAEVLNSPCFMVKSWLVHDQTVHALASPKANGNGPVINDYIYTRPIKVIAPRTAEEIVARGKERKSYGTPLLMAHPEISANKFHKRLRQKRCGTAIKSQFGGNEESKMKRSIILKQQLKGFFFSLMRRTKPGVTVKSDDLYNIKIDEYDLEEMRLKVASGHESQIRMKKFYRRLASLPRECESKELRKKEGGMHGNLETKMGAEFGQKEDSKALVTIDGEGVDWTNHSEDEDYALMACNSSDSDTEREQLSDASIEIKAYSQGLKKVEAQLVAHQQGQLWKLYGHLDLCIEVRLLTQSYICVQNRLNTSDPSFPKQGEFNLPVTLTLVRIPLELVSELVVNESNIECQPKVWSDAPIIEEYESDSEDEYVSTPRKEQETPSFVNQQVKTPRESIKNQFTHSQKPKVDKTELGYGFTVRACFVCGSLNHLIRDCDFHEKRMARKAKLNNGWNNVQRVNKQNQFVPSASILELVKFQLVLLELATCLGTRPTLLKLVKTLMVGPVAFGGSKGYITGRKGSRGNTVMPESTQNRVAKRKNMTLIKGISDQAFYKTPYETFTWSTKEATKMQVRDIIDAGDLKKRLIRIFSLKSPAICTEDVLSTDKEKVSTDKEKVSTDRPIVSTDGSKVSTDKQIEGTEEQIKSTDGQRKGIEDHTEEGNTTQVTQTPTSNNICGQADETIVSESDDLPQAEKKFTQLESDEVMARDNNKKEREEQEREQFTIEERAKFLHDTIAAQRKFLAQQRSEAIRNRPPTKNQLRNQMMTYLKHVGNFKHAELKIEDEVLDSSKSEVIKEESKEEVQEESKEEESTRKRKLGTRKKMKSRKRRYIQNTSEDDSDKENDELRLHLTIAPDEEKEVDYEILDRKYPIKEWKTECLGTKPQADKAEHFEEINQNVVIRSNGQKRYFSTLMRVLSIFDREDLNVVYQLVMDRFQDEIPEGFDRVLWGDLMVMFNPDDENEFWNSQQDWNIVSWKLHGSSGVHTLVTETGLVIHMLVEKKYPLRKEVLMQMLKLKLESEEDSTMALELIRFIKKLLAELEPEDFDGDEEDL